MSIHPSQIQTVETSAGAGDAGKIPRLNSSGQLDASVGGGGGGGIADWQSAKTGDAWLSSK